MEYKGIEYLRKKLDKYRVGALQRQKIYDMKNKEIEPSLTIPQPIRQRFRATLGWCAKAVDSIADRLVFKGFTNDNFNLNEIFQLNSADVLFDDAMLSALINSCSFIYISEGDEDIPRMQVIPGSEATGILDPITRMLTEGYAVLSRDEIGNPIEELYFITGETDYYINGQLVSSVPNNAPYPLLVPIIHRPDASRPFGRSRITKGAIYWQRYAIRTLERADVAAEFYSFPQKYVVGLSQDAEPMDAWKATISAMLQFTKDEDGDSPKLGQFQQQSMAPFTEQLKNAASGFAGETGLTLDDLGFSTDNPASAEAIKASHETLRLAAEKAQRDFALGFLNAGYLAACLRDNFPYKRNQLYQTKPRWQPVFKPDAAAIAVIGDGAIKLNQAVPGFLDVENLEDLTGIEGGSDG